MYHIKDDKRCEKSTELIISSVMELTKEKTLNEITISDVQERSTVSRATFYRNFDELIDVMRLLCDRGFNAILSEFTHSNDMEVTDIAEQVYRYWYVHSDILEALVACNRTDILYSSMHEYVKKLDVFSWLTDNNRSVDYLVSIISYGMIGIIVNWVEHGKKEGMHELKVHLREAFEMMATVGIFLKEETN